MVNYFSNHWDHFSMISIFSGHVYPHFIITHKLLPKRPLLAQSGHSCLYDSFCRQLAQSSSVSPGTRSNSLVLFVTMIGLTAMACPAIAVSFVPIVVPARRSATLITVVASTAARSQGRTAVVTRSTGRRNW